MLPKNDFSQYQYPLRTLFMGNEDTWNSMMAVISDLKPEQLAYTYPNYKQRSIAEMINHTMDSQYLFYTKHLVMGEETPNNIYPNLAKTAEEAISRIVDTYTKTTELWKKITPAMLSKEIKTEWGQVLTGEPALFQSITHTHYHVSEICFLRGLGGFPTSALG